MREEELLRELLIERDPKAHKGDFGRTLIVGGSPRYPNAPVLAAYGAEQAGPGYVALASDEDIATIIKRKSPPRCIFEDDYFLKNPDEITLYDSYLFGNGIAFSEESQAKLLILFGLLREDDALIVDATGLEVYGGMLGLSFRGHLLLTPHLGEAKRLFHSKVMSKEPEDYLPEASGYAKVHNCHILLKGYRSILVFPDGGHQISKAQPTPSLAKAGSGDVLSGFLSGLWAVGKRQGLPFGEVILFGDYLFHEAMREYEDEYGAGVIASTDLHEALKQYVRRRK